MSASTGSAVNDYLIWAWGWELDASLYAGYGNEIVASGLTNPPTVPSSIVPSSYDWVSVRGWAADTYPRQGVFDVFSIPGYRFGSPWNPDAPLPNGKYPWSISFPIRPNYKSTRDGLNWAPWPLVAVGPGVNPFALRVQPGELGESFNADFTDPARIYGAGEHCLILAGADEINLGDINASVFEVPMLFTPHIGKYNLAISASTQVGAAVTYGPRSGWIQTSYKAVCNQYEFTPTLASTLMKGPPAAPGGSLECAGGSVFNPIITMWTGTPPTGLGNANQMWIGLFPEDQDPQPLLPGALPVTARNIMLSIAPLWQNGTGPTIPFPSATPGPTFGFNWDRDWHRIAIKFSFDPVGGAAGVGRIEAEVYLDGILMVSDAVDATVIDNTLNPFNDWNRIGFGGGVALSYFDHRIPYTDNARFWFTSWGMHDHFFVWGNQAANGLEKLYVQGLRPNVDIIHDVGGSPPNSTTGTGWWKHSASAVAPTTGPPIYPYLADSSDPDVWSDYAQLDPPLSLYPIGRPVWVDGLWNTGQFVYTGIPKDSLPGNIYTVDTSYTSYWTAFEKTTDIKADWIPADIRGVQQLSIHSFDEGGENIVPKYVYSTMSIGPMENEDVNLVCSWPQRKLDYFFIPVTDRAAAHDRSFQNIISVFSSASVGGGSKWTHQNLNNGTGSLHVSGGI